MKMSEEEFNELIASEGKKREKKWKEYHEKRLRKANEYIDYMKKLEANPYLNNQEHRAYRNELELGLLSDVMINDLNASLISWDSQKKEWEIYKENKDGVLNKLLRSSDIRKAEKKVENLRKYISMVESIRHLPNLEKIHEKELKDQLEHYLNLDDAADYLYDKFFKESEKENVDQDINALNTALRKTISSFSSCIDMPIYRMKAKLNEEFKEMQQDVSSYVYDKINFQSKYIETVDASLHRHILFNAEMARKKDRNHDNYFELNIHNSILYHYENLGLKRQSKFNEYDLKTIEKLTEKRQIIDEITKKAEFASHIKDVKDGINEYVLDFNFADFKQSLIQLQNTCNNIRRKIDEELKSLNANEIVESLDNELMIQRLVNRLGEIKYELDKFGLEYNIRQELENEKENLLERIKQLGGNLVREELNADDKAYFMREEDRTKEFERQQSEEKANAIPESENLSTDFKEEQNTYERETRIQTDGEKFALSEGIDEGLLAIAMYDLNRDGYLEGQYDSLDANINKFYSMDRETAKKVVERAKILSNLENLTREEMAKARMTLPYMQGGKEEVNPFIRTQLDEARNIYGILNNYVNSFEEESKKVI